jgi:hypothetical protein
MAVVAVAPFRPNGADRHGVVDWSIVPPVLAKDSVIFAPSFAWRGKYELDGVMRRYPATVLMADGDKGGPERETPTLPYLAALYADAGRDPAKLRAVDCSYAAPVGTLSTNCAGVPKSPDRRLDRALNGEAEARILFSLPSLVPGPHGERPFQAAQFQGRYDLYPVSAMLDDKGALRQPALIRDKIVIVSTSAVTALDHHDTPLGDMAGAEVVLNAVKAFLDGGLVAEPGPLERFGHEAVVIAASSIPFLAFWVLYFWIGALLRGSRVGMVIQPAFATLGFLATVLAAMALAAVVTIGPLTRGFQEGFALEFFTPIFALSLEGFAEGARWTIDRIEHVVEAAVLAARKRLTRRKPPTGVEDEAA